ncbi:MAG: heavy metal translocating P-type ATPase [Paracoccaceae bacterium]|nr:heavy metal translocating P-type ATPase [Paracoccaceae bacterium]
MALDNTTQGAAPHHARIRVEGMTCASCVGRVQKAVAAVPGVTHASVNLATETLDVDFTDETSPEIITEAIHKAGYETAQEEVTLSVQGMTCASCVGRVERALKQAEGVISASVNLANESAHIVFSSGLTTAEQLAEIVNKAGYEASIKAADDAAKRDERRDQEIVELRRRTLLAAWISLPVVLLAMGEHFIPGVKALLEDTIGLWTSWAIQFVLTTIVMAGPGRLFLKKGFPALLRGEPDMNSLVALGTSAAWIYSTVVLFAPSVIPEGSRGVYYEAAAAIVTLILLGRWLEARAKGRTGAAIRHLVGLRPKSARVERNGQIMELDVSNIRVGDLIHLRPGERVAVDGEVVEGSSYIDESMITGEPMPVEKKAGDEVTGGTINKTGALKYRATRVGADTVLAQIIRMVEEAQGAKLPIQAMVDKVTLWFVPVVLGIAALTVAVWLTFGPDLAHALVAGVAVLIIACPCAMGLATPTSIMVGTGRGAEMGVLFRKGDALQTLSDVRVIALDKTGTLTEGRPELTDFKVVEGQDENAVLAAVAALESSSEHPIAGAIVTAAEERGLTLPEVRGFAALAGFGVSAEVGGQTLAAGADRYMEKLGIDVAPLAPVAEELATDGKTPLYVAVEGELAAVLAVADKVKESTPEAIKAFHDMGLKVAMLTGDNRKTAEAVARKLGIDEVVAEILPDGKVAELERLRGLYGKLAFVGDGINDAPALASADVGIAIGTGTDVAIESADVVLMSGDLTAAARAVELSRAVMRNIKQNLFWAFGYNTILIPVAAGVLYPLNGMLLSPMIAAGAMGLSSVFVLTNALRLRRFRARGEEA